MQAAELKYHLHEIRNVLYSANSCERGYHLGNNCFLVIEGTTDKVADIRMYYRLIKEENRLQPTKKGVKLTANDIEKIIDALNEIENDWPAMANIAEPCFLFHMKEENAAEFLMCTHCNPIQVEYNAV